MSYKNVLSNADTCYLGPIVCFKMTCCRRLDLVKSFETINFGFQNLAISTDLLINCQKLTIVYGYRGCHSWPCSL